MTAAVRPGREHARQGEDEHQREVRRQAVGRRLTTGFRLRTALQQRSRRRRPPTGPENTARFEYLDSASLVVAV